MAVWHGRGRASRFGQPPIGIGGGAKVDQIDHLRDLQSEKLESATATHKRRGSTMIRLCHNTVGGGAPWTPKRVSNRR